MRFPLLLLLALAGLTCSLPRPCGAVGVGPAPWLWSASPTWSDDYRTAYQRATDTSRRLLVWFTSSHSLATADSSDRVVDEWVRQGEVRDRIDDFVLVRVPPGTMIQHEGRPMVLAEHPAFAELNGRPGLAIVDLSDTSSPHYGNVVSILPFAENETITARNLTILLDLPSGSLSQRTLVYAVRCHPEAPQSAAGEFHPLLSAEAARHSTYQAELQLQGHHHWDQRFYRLNEQLPAGLVAIEVCAESWPGQSLLAAARECVRSWSQSPGHWNSVRQAHPVFGYDMKRGRNGVWYATGVFGTRR